LIAFLNGKVDNIGSDHIDIDVNGVGYRVYSPASSLERIRPGDSVKVYTLLIVREDAMILFGFITPEELELFQKLITVSGVGPKVALAVLSAMPAAVFCHYVAAGDVDQIVKVPGIGKKTGQRIILELKDKLPDLAVDDVADDVSTSKREAAEALVSLGFNPAQVRKVLSDIDETGMDTAKLIRECLARLRA
jgi:Holliday junction DNA helicase RuvA